MERREVLVALSATLVGTLPSSAILAQNTAGTCLLSPQTEDGPFYFDPKLVRADIREDKRGMPLELRLRVVTAGDCSSIKHCRTDIWQVDAQGLYSGYDQQTGTARKRQFSASGKTFLRGTQFTDDGGVVVFRTIYPSWYSGRTPHIHFKVFLDDRLVVTSQIFFPDDVNDQVFAAAPYQARDPVRDTYNHNDRYLENGALGVMCKVARYGEGYRATLDVGVRQT